MLNGENRGNILYVEDNPDNRLLIRRILGSEGFTIYEAESATKALDVLQNIHPDLILMDINLPWEILWNKKIPLCRGFI